MSSKALILSSLLVALASNDVAASKTEPETSDELLAQRERLMERLDALKSKLELETQAIDHDQIVQWHNWSNWQNGWRNY